MKTETLVLTGNTMPGLAGLVQAVLQKLDGVQDVLVIEAKNECSVLFDDKLLSSQTLQAALTDAGYANKKKESGHGQNGSCCGSCGG